MHFYHYNGKTVDFLINLLYISIVKKVYNPSYTAKACYNNQVGDMHENLPTEDLKTVLKTVLTALANKKSRGGIRSVSIALKRNQENELALLEDEMR